MEKEKKDKEERAKKKKEKLERILNPPKHRLEDSTYVEEIKNNAEKVEHALRQGRLIHAIYFLLFEQFLSYPSLSGGISGDGGSYSPQLPKMVISEGGEVVVLRVFPALSLCRLLLPQTPFHSHHKEYLGN